MTPDDVTPDDVTPDDVTPDDVTPDAVPVAPVGRGRRTLTGLGLIIGGALLGMLAMTALPWYRGSFNGILDNGTSASRIRSSISIYEQQPPSLQPLFSLGVSPVYFSWLGLATLLVAAVAGVVGAGLEARAARVVAAAAGVIALAGLVLTGFAIQYVRLDGELFRRDVPGYFDFVAQSSVGAWAMVLGYVAVGVGAVLAAGSRDALRELLADEPEPTGDAPIATEPPVEKPAKRENW